MAFRWRGRRTSSTSTKWLDYKLAVDNDRLIVGACVRHGAFHTPAAPGPLGALLASVVRNIAHYPIRTRGTMCGSLANADPASEWCPTAVTLDAEMVAKSVDGERVVPAHKFFKGIMSTALTDNELLTEVRLPLLPEDTRFGFNEFSRRAGDFAMSAALVAYRLKDGKIAEPRVGVGGAESHPRRIAEAEQALTGQAPGEKAFRAAADAAGAAIDPLEDLQTSADYRREWSAPSYAARWRQVSAHERKRPTSVRLRESGSARPRS